MGQKERIVTIPYSPRSLQLQIHGQLDVSRFSVVVAHRRFGKTVCMINHTIKAALQCTKERPRYAYIAPLFSQAKGVAWDYLKHYTSVIPGVKRNESELWVELPGKGARIRLYGADNPDSLRGLYFDGVILDEVAQMRPEVWGEVIRPAVADRMGWVVFIGTPAGINLFFTLYQQASKGAPGWWSGVYRASETGVIPNDELAAARDAMSEQQYLQEFECDFGASLPNVFITLSLALAAAKRRVDSKAYRWAPLILSVDVARFGDDSSVILLRQGLQVLKVDMHHDLDTMALAAEVARQIELIDPATVFVDSVGIGAGVVDRLRALGHQQVIEVNGGAASSDPQHKNKRAEMWAGMRDWLREGSLGNAGERMIADLTGVLFKYDSANRLQLESKEDMRKRGLLSPDAGDALAMSFAYPVGVDRQVRKSQAEAHIDHIQEDRRYSGIMDVLWGSDIERALDHTDDAGEDVGVYDGYLHPTIGE